MSINLKLTYSLKLFSSSTDEKFIEALDVYRRSVSRNEKTSTNEIVWTVDHRSRFRNSQPYFFGLELNNKIIGYAELAIIKRTRYIAIDYIIIDSKYKTHSAFYSFFMLIIEYFNSIKLDYDYIGIEILTKNAGTVSVEEISKFEFEGFKVVNQLYIQPCLEQNNFDSQQEAILMIYQRNYSSNTISKDSYCDIVKSIYFDYYHEWDCNFFRNEVDRGENYKKLTENYEKVVSTISEDEIVLNGYPFKKMSAEDKIIPKESTINKKLWQALFFVVIFSVIVLGILLAVKQMNIELIVAAIIFVVLIFIWLSFLAFSEDKAMKLLSNIPIISKLFERLK